MVLETTQCTAASLKILSEQKRKEWKNLGYTTFTKGKGISLVEYLQHLNKYREEVPNCLRVKNILCWERNGVERIQQLIQEKTKESKLWIRKNETIKDCDFSKMTNSEVENIQSTQIEYMEFLQDAIKRVQELDKSSAGEIGKSSEAQEFLIGCKSQQTKILLEMTQMNEIFERNQIFAFI